MNKRNSDLYLYLSIIFTTCLLLSNILAAKLIKIGNYSVTAGVIVFPISYIISDIFAEVYGFQKTKKIIYFGFFNEFINGCSFFNSNIVACTKLV